MDPSRRPPARRHADRHQPEPHVADFGAAPIGVPNFVIDQFTIPPFLLPIYQACGTQYGIPWQVLASINRIETAFGTNLNVSTAGALGWMQFMPSTWQMYGVDANDDGRKDPYNPVDAICAAARYLKAAGGDTDLRTAIFAYNHADWYVDEVLLYANQYGKLPEALVSSLTGLTEGARFPVAANARYADDISERQALKRSKPGKGAVGNVADVISGSPTRRGINIYSREGAPVVAVNDGVITKIGKSNELGRYIVLRDAYGNRFTYAQLGDVSDVYPVPKPQQLSAEDFKLVTPRRPGARRARDRAASRSTSESDDGKTTATAKQSADERRRGRRRRDGQHRGLARPPLRLPRAQAQRRPRRPHRPARLAARARRCPATSRSRATSPTSCASTRRRWSMRAARRRARRSTAGTVLGKIGKTDELAPHVHFSIRPAGRGAPKIDPKPILDGWKLLEATAIYRAAGKNPFDGSAASASQVLLMSKAAARCAARSPTRSSRSTRAAARTSAPARSTAACWRCSSSSTARGYQLTITSLKCGHSILTTSGQRQRALDRQRRRTSRRSTASRCSATRARARSPRRWSRTC